MARKTILIDFDGTLTDYKGEFSLEDLGRPLPKARQACLLLNREFRLVCFTTRKPVESVERWLRFHGFPEMKVTDVKERAMVIVDDRAVTFQGVWTDELIAQIKAFTPHWERGS